MPFQIVRDDITRMQVDAIVNTANPYPRIGSGTDYAIYQAAGADRLLKEREKIGIIQRGDVAVTPAFDLKAKWILHTVGPIWKDGKEQEAEILRSCYAKSLQLAASKKCQSIAFPLISTGNYGFPKELALQIVISEISSFLLKHDMMIYLVVFDAGATRLSERLYREVEKRIDDRYAERQREKENVEYRVPDDERNETTLFGARPDYNAFWRGEWDYPTTGQAMMPTISHAMESFVDSYEDLEEEQEEELSDSFWDDDEAIPKSGSPSPNAYQTVSMDSASEDVYQTAHHEEYSSSIGSAAKSGKGVGSLLYQVAKPKRSLKDVLGRQNETFQQMLLRLIKEKGLTNVEAYTKANQDKKLFSKIKKDVNYQPKKKTAMAFALALQLNLDETRDLLSRAGYAFSPASDFDTAIQYFIENREYDIYEIEIVLYDLGLESLCNYA